MTRALYVPLDAALSALREVASSGASAVQNVSDDDRSEEQASIHRTESREAAALIAKQVSAERCFPDVYVKGA